MVGRPPAVPSPLFQMLSCPDTLSLSHTHTEIMLSQMSGHPCLGSATSTFKINHHSHFYLLDCETKYKENEQPCSGLPTWVLETEMGGVCVCSVAVSRNHPTGQQQRPTSHSHHGQGQTRATLGSGCLMSTVTGPDTEDHRPESENDDAEMKAPSKGTHACFCSM